MFSKLIKSQYLMKYEISFSNQLLLQSMGCGSQKGCLGPKPRQRQVYLDLVETIYHEAATLQKNQNEDLYVSIKNHLTKKGLLRKLIDNLASHKSNIEECMQQNFKMSVSSDVIQGRMVSLIIVDKIIDDCLRDKKVEENNKFLQENLSPNSNHILNQSTIMVHFQNDMTTEIYHRLSMLFLNLIEYLFEKEIKLQRESVNSLKKFLTLKNDKLLTKVEINHIFELLIVNIKQNKLVEESIDSVALILSRLKESTTNEINKDQLCFFLRQWLSVDQQKRQQREKGILRVLKEYFNRAYIQYEVLNLSIITVLDEVYFQLKACLKMQELLLSFNADRQTVKHYMKRIFVSFLKYFQSNYQNQQIFKSSLKHVEDEKSKQNIFKTLTKWIVNEYVQMNSIIEYNASVILIFIYNIEKKGIVENEMKTQFFKIISFLNDESLLTITTLISQEMKEKVLILKNRELLFTLFQQIFKTRKSLIQNPGNIMKVKFVVNIQKFYSRQLKMKVLSFASTSLRMMKIQVIRQNTQFYDTFCLRLIEFIYSIYQQIIFTFAQDEVPTSPKSPKQLGMSKGSMRDLNKLIFLHRFVLQILKMFAVFKECKLFAILLSFISQLNTCLENFDPYSSEENAIIFYFLVFVIQKNLFMMNSRQKIIEQIGKISVKMQLNQINFDHFQQIINTSRSIVKSQMSLVVLSEMEGLNTPRKYESRAKTLIKTNKLRIDAVQRLFMVESLQISQIDQIFKQHFRLQYAADNKNVFSQSSSNILFHRIPSIKITVEDLYSQKHSDRGEEEHSFQQILSKIKKE